MISAGRGCVSLAWLVAPWAGHGPTHGGGSLGGRLPTGTFSFDCLPDFRYAFARPDSFAEPSRVQFIVAVVNHELSLSPTKILVCSGSIDAS